MKWEALLQKSPDEILAWAESQSWCHSMSQCLQDPEWHSEGDVWTHTQKVIHELLELKEWPVLTLHEQTVLIFTALFHDIAKPLTTEIDPITGRVTSPKHAVKGEHLTRGILRDLECEFTIREEISRMVRFHGRPAFLLERSHPINEVIRLSWLLSNRLLYLFAVADTRGRDTDSMTRPEENLRFWQLASEEANCFDRPFHFTNDHARFLFFRQSEPNLHYVPHEKYSCVATILSGLPGSGKDTWLKTNMPGVPIVSLDDVREELGTSPTEDQGKVAQFARERCRAFLRKEQAFVFNATNTLRQTRTRWIDLFADYHARIEVVYLEPTFDRILHQNKMRSQPVPERVI